MKVAIVHDYFLQRGGGERVAGVLHEIFPDAPIYTLLVDKDKLWPSLQDAEIIPSFLQQFGFIRKHFKLFFWLYPWVITHMRIRGSYDLVISSSSAYAKGIRLPKQNRPVHVCYCYTPMRFAWDFERYIRNETSHSWLRFLASWFVPSLKKWDFKTAKNVDLFIAISEIIRERIKQYYDRDSFIVYPPVEIRNAEIATSPKDYFLVVSRLVSYKRVDLAVQACSQANLKLKVIGEGPDRSRLESLAGPSVSFLGWQSEETVTKAMAHCRALVFPGVEDFGLTPVESNLLGRPVVAFRGGGALDTIQDGLNGVFFNEPSVESLHQALTRISELSWDGQKIREFALRFDKSVFVDTMQRLAHNLVSSTTSGLDEARKISQLKQSDEPKPFAPV